MLRGDPLRLVELVEGPAAIAARVTELPAGAKQEVLAFDVPPYVTPDAAAARDEREVLAMPERAELLRELVPAGERSRVLPRVPLTMVVVDGRDAVIPLSASTSGTRSERTLRRRVTDLLARLGATSRFQAGAQAIRRGWL